MKCWILSNKLYFLGTLFGGLAGFLYYKYVGCVSGTCAITSNPYKSSLYGAFLGVILLSIFKPDNKKSPTKI